MDLNQLFQDNIRLAYSFTRKFKPMPSMDKEDYLQEMIIALWQATKKFRLDGGAQFSTFGYTAMWFRRKQLMRSEARRLKAIGQTGQEFEDEVIHHDGNLERKEAQETVDMVVDRLDGNAKLIVGEVLKGKVLGDIGKGMGVSRQRVHFIYHRAINRLRKELVS